MTPWQPAFENSVEDVLAISLIWRENKHNLTLLVGLTLFTCMCQELVLVELLYKLLASEIILNVFNIHYELTSRTWMNPYYFLFWLCSSFRLSLSLGKEFRQHNPSGNSLYMIHSVLTQVFSFTHTACIISIKRQRQKIGMLHMNTRLPFPVPSSGLWSFGIVFSGVMELYQLESELVCDPKLVIQHQCLTSRTLMTACNQILAAILLPRRAESGGSQRDGVWTLWTLMCTLCT